MATAAEARAAEARAAEARSAEARATEPRAPPQAAAAPGKQDRGGRARAGRGGGLRHHDADAAGRRGEHATAGGAGCARSGGPRGPLCRRPARGRGGRAGAVPLQR
ncbi:unnamed protein product [Prorocentrum cordatum]|uniref:Uncharacterized protein n=1 Tax=Prorocentrum cordatum TaxID=2364126 RepID=A0ABN9RLD0_9DINO|nr:unnamed protein product [Polarella glacialis]